MTHSTGYRQQSRAYIEHLKRFVPWISIPTLARVAHAAADIETPLAVTTGIFDGSTSLPSNKTAVGHNYFDRAPREGLTPEENQLGCLWSTKRDSLWRTKRIPKRSGGQRVLHIPNALLKQLQRATVLYLNTAGFLHTHEAATAFSAGQSIIKNAALHRRPFLMIRLDVKNFFPSITSDRISTYLKSKGMHPRLATLIAALVTYRNRLPQGAPSSPALCNAVCQELDRDLSALAAASKVAYSRYADDIVLSSRRRITRLQLTMLILRARSILARAGLSLNHAKTKVLFRHHRQMVTGVVVNEKLLPPRRFRQELRATIHNCSRRGFLAEAEHYTTLKGPFTYEDIKPDLALWEAAKERSQNDPARRELIRRLTRVRRRGRYADYERLQGYVPKRLRERLPNLSQESRYAAIDFWFFTSGLIGYYAQFDPTRANRYRSALLASIDGQPASRPSGQHEVGEVQCEWEKVLDEMLQVSQAARLSGLVSPFDMSNPPPLDLKQLVAKSRIEFEYFAVRACVYLVETHRRGVQELPSHLKEGKIVINDLRLLRNYFSHKPDKRDEERTSDICTRHTGQRTFPAEEAAWQAFQTSLLRNILEWVLSIKRHIREGMLSSGPS